MNFLLIFFLILSQVAICQTDMPKPYSVKGRFYLYWGYNRAFFTQSDIHIDGPRYNFWIYDVEATDRPTQINKGSDFLTYIKPSSFTIPQYNYRLGFHFTERFSLSVGLDHLKYVMKKGQNLLVSGTISEEASARYQGLYENKRMDITEDFFKFEHTNGLNYLSVEAEYSYPFWRLKNNKLIANIIGGAGGGWAIPKTDVKVFGEGLDNDFHIAGYGLSGKIGLRLDFLKHFFIAGDLKCGYFRLPAVLIANNPIDLAHHNFGFLEYYFVAGVRFKVFGK